MPRRKKPANLNEAELQAFLRDAEQLHDTICQPLISPASNHYRALLALNQAIVAAVHQVTGKNPDWVSRSSSGLAGKIR